DILIIMLANMVNIKFNLKIWMEVGVGNNRRVINVSKLYERLGESLCASLPGFHALTGCDYNPAFYRKGKKRPFNLLKTSKKFQKALINLSRLKDSNFNNVVESIEEFICRLYTLKKK